MKVKVKMDKFGRILIPKKIREAKGYEYGMELSLVMEPETATVEIKPVEKSPYIFEYNELGLMTFRRKDGRKSSYDVVEMIAESREERRAIVAGEMWSDGTPRNNPNEEE